MSILERPFKVLLPCPIIGKHYKTKRGKLRINNEKLLSYYYDCITSFCKMTKETYDKLKKSRTSSDLKKWKLTEGYFKGK
jgi:hypothetical protein